MRKNKIKTDKQRQQVGFVTATDWQWMKEASHNTEDTAYAMHCC
jgi:hypothetical protein